MDEAFRLFEKFFILNKKYSKWFAINDDGVQRIMKLFQLGYCYPLAERDEHGRRILFYETQRIDVNYFTSCDAAR